MSRRVYQADDMLGLRMIPNVRVRASHESKTYLIQANSHGFRCRHDFVAAQADGTKRILLYGDSFTVGVGVGVADRFGDRVEQAIDGLEVYNLGLTGSGTDQQFLAHRHVGEGLDHDAVVLVPWVENIRRNPARQRVWNDRWSDESLDDSIVWQPKPYFDLQPDGSLALGNVPVPPAVPFHELPDSEREYSGPAGRLPRTRAFVKRVAPGAKDLLQRVGRFQPVAEYDDPDNPAWLLMRAIIEQWHREIDRPMLVCPIPMYQHIEGHASSEGYRARFQELHRPNDGLFVHDVLPAMQDGSAAARRAMRFERDIHFNERGHAAFASALEPAVRALLDQ